jgi:hypothetical protein
MTEQYYQHEALYLISFRGPRGPEALQDWIKTNSKRQEASVENGKMHIYNTHTLNKFCVTWDQDWSMTLIWDCWNKRHLYV